MINFSLFSLLFIAHFYYTIYNFFIYFYQISIYFPDTFYELWGGLQLNQTRHRKPLKALDYSIVLTDFPIFLRSGKIIALHNVQSTRLSADESRLDEFYLKIGLSCNTNGGNEVESINGNLTRTCSASGILMFSSQTSWKFNVLNRKVNTICNVIVHIQMGT